MVVKVTAMDHTLPVLAARPSTVDMLAHLVAFDTTSRNSNQALIGFVQEFLGAHGVLARTSLSAADDKTNLHAIIGPQAAGGIALSGHVDTVPVDGQDWSHNPFVLRAEAGKLYGRGACDMKGFVASCLAAVPDLVAMNLARPIHLFITFDEETTMEGARVLMHDLAASGLRPDMCVVGEPSLMQPILAHKGRVAIRVRVRGRAGHSSEPARGVNAVFAAAQAIGHVAAEAKRLSVEGPFVEGFDPPHTTAHVGTMSGGTILNIIPDAAEFVMEWRCVPGHDPHAEYARLRAYIAEHIEPAMHAIDPATGFTYEVIGDIPGMGLAEGHALTALIKQVTGSNSTGKVSYGTEGGIYEGGGIPTIVCGPGSIQQAHKPDEWIAQSELDACDRFIRSLAQRLSHQSLAPNRLSP
jgi:acetylornithine deacetylase